MQMSVIKKQKSKNIFIAFLLLYPRPFVLFKCEHSSTFPHNLRIVKLCLWSAVAAAPHSEQQSTVSSTLHPRGISTPLSAPAAKHGPFTVSNNTPHITTERKTLSNICLRNVDHDIFLFGWERKIQLYLFFEIQKV